LGVAVGTGVGSAAGACVVGRLTNGTREATATAGGSTGSADGSADGSIDGSVDGWIDGSVDGVGSTPGWVVGAGPPGVEVAGARVDPGVGFEAAGEVALGAGETIAMAGLGRPAVDGSVERPEIPTLSATVARTTLTTPRATTSRRRCAAVTSVGSPPLGAMPAGAAPCRRW
jgi:hypothetical protein